MFETLRAYIDNVTGSVITDEEFEHFKTAFAEKHIKRKQFLLHEGNVCKYMTFIVKGAVKQYRVDDEGYEQITSLAVETWWISDRESFLNRSPSPYNIVAVEDCEVLVADLPALATLKERSGCFLEMAHKLDQNSFIASQKRIEATLSFTAEQKLNYLLETNPSFITRFPQNVIASYLGLTPETLSRVRRSIMSR